MTIYTQLGRKVIGIAILFIFFTKGVKAQSFVNGSLEAWGAAQTCEINTAPDGWLNFSNGCSAVDEAQFPLCPSTIPPNASNGNIYARACCGVNQGEGISQTVSGFTPGLTYTISFDYAGSNLYAGSDSVYWNVFIDTSNLFHTPTFSSTKSTWSTFAVNFVATDTSHTFGFRAYSLPPVWIGGSAGIDNIQLSMPGGETGVGKQIDKNEIVVYPTIMEKSLYVKMDGHEAMDLFLYDLNSKQWKKEKISGSTILNVEALPSGVYVCVIRQHGAVVFKQTVMKN